MSAYLRKGPQCPQNEGGLVLEFDKDGIAPFSTWPSLGSLDTTVGGAQWFV